MNEVLKYEMQKEQETYKVKFFSRPHPLGGVTYAFDQIVNDKSVGLVESRDKQAVLKDFYSLKNILEREGYNLAVTN